MTCTSNRGRQALRLRIILASVVLLAACHPIRGCSEAQFDLAPESRLPKWFANLSGIRRDDVTVELWYYMPLVSTERTATVILRTRQGTTIDKIVATLKGMEPLTVEPHGESGPIPYPLYEVLTANGITEVIEHRRMEPVFYITDDPVVRQKLGVDQ